MNYTLSDLAKDVSNRYEAQKERQKNNYDLARKLGFSSQEAMVLSGKSSKLIFELAEAKDGAKHGKPST